MNRLNNNNLANRLGHHIMSLEHVRHMGNSALMRNTRAHHEAGRRLVMAEIARRARVQAARVAPRMQARRTNASVRKAATHWLQRTRNGAAMRPSNRGGTIYRRAENSFLRAQGKRKNASTSPRRTPSPQRGIRN